MNDSVPQKEKPALTQEAFDRLLYWLDRDREQAGEKYEKIRSRLITIFTCRGCVVPEEMTDETINRVVRKIHEISDKYVGDPALYFYGVAQNVHLEYLRKKPAPVLLPQPSSKTEEAEIRYECLEQCMERLSATSRELILAYYEEGEDKETNKERRKELAGRLGIGLNALWIRVHRIRESLRECVDECLNRNQAQ